MGHLSSPKSPAGGLLSSQTVLNGKHGRAPTLLRPVAAIKFKNDLFFQSNHLK